MSQVIEAVQRKTKTSGVEIKFVMDKFSVAN